eukprot:1447934-Amphidinium_carterae.1
MSTNDFFSSFFENFSCALNGVGMHYCLLCPRPVSCRLKAQLVLEMGLSHVGNGSTASSSDIIVHLQNHQHTKEVYQVNHPHSTTKFETQ